MKSITIIKDTKIAIVGPDSVEVKMLADTIEVQDQQGLLFTVLLEGSGIKIVMDADGYIERFPARIGEDYYFANGSLIMVTINTHPAYADIRSHNVQEDVLRVEAEVRSS